MNIYIHCDEYDEYTVPNQYIVGSWDFVLSKDPNSFLHFANCEDVSKLGYPQLALEVANKTRIQNIWRNKIHSAEDYAWIF